MDKDYLDFVKRMGSFEEELDVETEFGLGVEDIELKHFGILGMKWGVRKDDSPTMARAKALVANKAALSDMANNELQNLVTKLNLERQLNDIVGKYEADNPSIMKSVRGVIGNIAGKGVKMAAEAAQKQVVNYINDKINAGKPDPLKKITDADLIKATTRLSLENRFRELMKKRG